MKTFDEAVDEVIGKRLTDDPRKAAENADEMEVRYGLGNRTCRNFTVKMALTKLLIVAEEEPGVGGSALISAFELGMAVGMEMEKGETLSENLLREEKER